MLLGDGDLEGSTMTKLLEIFTTSLDGSEVRPMVSNKDEAVTREELVALFAKDLENNQASGVVEADQE